MTLLLYFLLQTGFIDSSGETTTLKAGPMIGYADMTEVCIWVQTKNPATVHLEVQGQDDASRRITPGQKTGQWNIAKIVVTHLRPNTLHHFQVYVDDKRVELPFKPQFKTTHFWQWREDPSPFTFAFGSCLYVNDTPWDRPGKPYGNPDLTILESIADSKADFMLWLGDNFYYREPDFYSKSMMTYRFERARKQKEMARLLGTMSHYATWDDHDYGPNNSNRNYREKEHALELFKAFWANPSYGFDGTPGVFGSFTWNDCDFFMLDNRYHRAPVERTEHDKAYYGQAQLQWLMDGLITSRAAFKFVINGNQINNIHNESEGFHTYRGEHRQLMDFLRDNQISGVVFLSGDRHFTELLKYDRPGTYPIYEYTSSPISSGVYDTLSTEKANPNRVPGTLVNTQHNFGTITIEGPRRARKLTFKCFDAKGKLLWEKSIQREEVRVPR